MHRLQRRRKRISRRPRRFQQIQTYLPSLKVDIGVADWREEFDGGGRVGI